MKSFEKATNMPRAADLGNTSHRLCCYNKVCCCIFRKNVSNNFGCARQEYGDYTARGRGSIYS